MDLEDHEYEHDKIYGVYWKKGDPTPFCQACFEDEKIRHLFNTCRCARISRFRKASSYIAILSDMSAVAKGLYKFRQVESTLRSDQSIT